MEFAELRSLYDRDERMNASFPDTIREEVGQIVRFITPQHKTAFILYSNLDEKNVDRVIVAQVDHFRNLGYRFEWKLYTHDQPSHLKERLAAHGATIEEIEAIMALDLQEAPLVRQKPVTADIRKFRGGADLDIIQSIQEQVWQEDFGWIISELGPEIEMHPELISVYIAFYEGVPASTAWIRYSQSGRWASLYGGSTLPEYRKRGLYSALLSVRAQEAVQRGYRFLTVDASPMSRPILEKHGFQTITWSYPCVWNFDQPEDEE